MIPPDYIARIRYLAVAHGVEDICAYVLDDPRFAVWSASSHPNLHHYGKGGLAQHTAEVLSLCLGSHRELGGLKARDIQALVCAAVAHDYGKIWDYHPVSPGVYIGTIPQPDVYSFAKWESTPHKTNIYHISRSAIEWSKAVDRLPQYRDIEDDVLHAILSHHGQKQWGSPVEPRSRIAWLLHLSDQMSARLNDCDTLHLKR